MIQKYNNTMSFVAIIIIIVIVTTQSIANTTVAAFPSTFTFDRQEVIDPRIVGGKKVTSASQFPFYVHSIEPILCGGTLVAPDIVLTAAHCQGAFIAGIRIGGLKKDGSDAIESNADVVLELPHPNFSDDTNLRNDIMLVKLRTPSMAKILSLVNLDDPTVPPPNEIVAIIGFGETSETGSLSDDLLIANVTVSNDKTCDKVYRDYDAKTMICAGTASGGRDSCQGDSGGPLFSIVAGVATQVGIVSGGLGCGRPNVPAYYTEVSAFASFVRQGICDLSSDPPATCPGKAPQVPTPAIISPQSVPPSSMTKAPTPVAPISVPSSTMTNAPTPATPIPVPSSAMTKSPVQVMASSAAPSPPIPTTPTTIPSPVTSAQMMMMRMMMNKNAQEVSAPSTMMMMMSMRQKLNRMMRVRIDNDDEEEDDNDDIRGSNNVDDTISDTDDTMNDTDDDDSTTTTRTIRNIFRGHQ